MGTSHIGTPHMGTPHIGTPHIRTSYRDTPYRDTPYRDSPYRDTPYRDTPHGDLHGAPSARSSQPQGGASAPAGSAAPRAKMAAATAVRALRVGAAGTERRGVWGQCGWWHCRVGCGVTVGGDRGHGVRGPHRLGSRRGGSGVWGHLGGTDDGGSGVWGYGDSVGGETWGVGTVMMVALRCGVWGHRGWGWETRGVGTP